MQAFPWLKDEQAVSNAIIHQTPLFFTGEMVFPHHFDTYPELAQIKEAADIIAAHSDWDDLYDIGQLSRNEVPVYAASYIEDMYVDFELARETASMVKGIKVYETNAMYHNALRACTEEVVGHLFKMQDDHID